MCRSVADAPLVLLTILLLSSRVVWGHGETDAEWRAVVTQVPAGLTAQTFQSPLGRQLVVASRGSTVVQVLAEDGQAFVRLTPDGAFGNFRHPYWFLSQNPADRPAPVKALKENPEPLWRQVGTMPSWGWWERRLNGASPEDRWQVSVRIDGRADQISGQFVPMDPPAHRTVPVLDTQTSLPANLSVQIIPDVQPAIRLAMRGQRSFFVLDSEGAPMLRLDTEGVSARLDSAQWQALGRRTDQSENQWAEISPTPAYTWPDSRLRLVRGIDIDRWSIPIRDEEGNQYEISGTWAEVPVENQKH